MKMNKTDIFWSNFDEWISYYRLNIHRFVEEYLGIHLYPFQKIVLYQMNSKHTTSLMFFAARGIGKSFLTMTFALAKAILYPGIKIRVAAPGIRQAVLLIRNYDDLRQMSPLLTSEIKDYTTNKDGGIIMLKNGSTISTVVCSEKARGELLNLAI